MVEVHEAGLSVGQILVASGLKAAIAVGVSSVLREIVPAYGKPPECSQSFMAFRVGPC
jgi:hypothetical protein